MKTWERYKEERLARGRKEGREEGRENLAREALDLMEKQPPDKVVDALYEFLSKARKNGNGKSE